jgi:DNA-binding transcriptional MocR family regulator
MTVVMSRGAEDVAQQLDRAEKDYSAFRARKLNLDLTRGKPSAEQLDLSNELLRLPDATYKSSTGTDCRNYGGLEGLPELRDLFAHVLQVPASQLMAGGNSSLEVMNDALTHAFFSRMPGSGRRWVEEREIQFLCPTPGYDRHFSLTDRFGIRMTSVPLDADGPDLDTVESLVRSDPSIKGIWCVPLYSNPTGTCYSTDTVQRMAAMECAAPDFRIFWDNAYPVHHLTDEELVPPSILDACTKAGVPDRPFVFGSTSKITFAGSGIGFFGASENNFTWFRAQQSLKTIGPDKINHLRHLLFLRDANGLTSHMRKHRDILKPKFDLVEQVFDQELAGLARWTTPKGGYFVTLEVPRGCAREVVRLASDMGIALTPAGATHPYGLDPQDSIIRIAPTFPSSTELEAALTGVTICVRVAAYRSAVHEVSSEAGVGESAAEQEHA